MGLVEVDLTKFGRDRLRAAVEAIILTAPRASAAPLPSSSLLQQGAKATLEGRDEPASIYFVSILEIAYLVASADGFADEERQALALLLERVTGHAVGHDAMDLHFRDLDDACAALGRTERLRRAAEDFDDGMSRSEALSFAALVAVADGKLADPESKALLQLGGWFGLSQPQVTQLVEAVVNRLRAELES
jgi:tellurite resistance protein